MKVNFKILALVTSALSFQVTAQPQSKRYGTHQGNKKPATRETSPTIDNVKLDVSVGHYASCSMAIEKQSREISAGVRTCYELINSGSLREQCAKMVMESFSSPASAGNEADFFCNSVSSKGPDDPRDEGKFRKCINSFAKNFLGEVEVAKLGSNLRSTCKDKFGSAIAGVANCETKAMLEALDKASPMYNIRDVERYSEFTKEFEMFSRYGNAVQSGR